MKRAEHISDPGARLDMLTTAEACEQHARHDMLLKLGEKPRPGVRPYMTERSADQKKLADAAQPLFTPGETTAREAGHVDFAALRAPRPAEIPSKSHRGSQAIVGIRSARCQLAPSAPKEKLCQFLPTTSQFTMGRCSTLV
jgi:hypothetical protein